MATQEAPGPEDGADTSSTGSSANMHFFRPNDGIYVSDGPESRTICVSPYLPPSMARTGEWSVDQFELHKELYRGKTSLLYMAMDRVSGIQVALKLYRKRKLSVLNRYQVEREVRLHINLHHENIIHLFAAFEDEKHVYMVQEFAVCGDLFEDLKKGGGQLKERYAVRDVIVPFLSALAYLHSQGIIHRDIKPENILLGANKVIKVADFGLSININHERPVTRAGTLDYMAPEVLVCPDKRRPEENKDKVLLGYTAQVDSWAVGILAYELLVGYPPFEQESRAATYEHIMYKEPKFPNWMTEDAKKFIGLALCKNASQRPTVQDLMQHTWVTPYMVRHMATPSSAPAANPGPSRLRNSVTHASEDAYHQREQQPPQQPPPPPPQPPPLVRGSGNGAMAAAAAAVAPALTPSAAATPPATPTAGPPTGSSIPFMGMLPMPPPQQHYQPQQQQQQQQYTPQPPQQQQQQQQQLASSVSNGMHGLHSSVPRTAGPPPQQSQYPSPPAGCGPGVAERNGMGGGTGAANAGGSSLPHHHPLETAATRHPHPAASSSTPHRSQQQQQQSQHPTLKTSISLQPQYPSGSQADSLITGSASDGSRLHDSISDPTIRSFELAAAHSPHPPGAVSAASLLPGSVGSRSGGGGTGGGAAAGAGELERAASGSVASSSANVSGGGARPGPLMSAGPSSNLTPRLHGHSFGHAHSPSPRPTPPSLALPLPLPLDSTQAADATPANTLSGGGGGTGESSSLPLSLGAGVLSSDPIPMSPSGPHPRGSSALSARSFNQVQTSGLLSDRGPQTNAANGPPRLRMASLVPPVNVNLGGMGGQITRMPAPPISPKPLTPDFAPGFTRPASGVLSDDTFLPPARSPSLSVGGHLTPLQAALLVPRPGSRLNSPSHSRRNSISQAGAAASQLQQQQQQLLQGLLQQHVSTPLPQLLSADYGCEMSPDDRPPSNQGRYGGGISAGGSVPASKSFGRLWQRDMATGNGFNGGLDSPSDGARSEFSSSGAAPNSARGPCPSSPMVRSVGGGVGGGGSAASAAARVRMLTPPEDVRPLMRESSISTSSHHRSAGGAGCLRDEIGQQSMTMYHRPGKVPGVGRAALAAREAEAAETAAGSAAGSAASLTKAKSLVVNRNVGALGEDVGPTPLGRLGPDVRAAVGGGGSAGGAIPTVAAAAAPPPSAVATQRSFTTANSAFARKLANGAIATKVTEYVRGRLPADQEEAEG